eukprot:scaffold128331_cov43-Prasinocladus_malaysianus.AAC.2
MAEACLGTRSLDRNRLRRGIPAVAAEGLSRDSRVLRFNDAKKRTWESEPGVSRYRNESGPDFASGLPSQASEISTTRLGYHTMPFDIHKSYQGNMKMAAEDRHHLAFPGPGCQTVASPARTKATLPTGGLGGNHRRIHGGRSSRPRAPIASRPFHQPFPCPWIGLQDPHQVATGGGAYPWLGAWLS